jgi:hypothetical protein
MTSPILLVGISNCRQWVILIVVEHRPPLSKRGDDVTPVEGGPGGTVDEDERRPIPFNIVSYDASPGGELFS